MHTWISPLICSRSSHGMAGSASTYWYHALPSFMSGTCAPQPQHVLEGLTFSQYPSLHIVEWAQYGKG